MSIPPKMSSRAVKILLCVFVHLAGKKHVKSVGDKKYPDDYQR